MSERESCRWKGVREGQRGAKLGKMRCAVDETPWSKNHTREEQERSGLTCDGLDILVGPQKMGKQFFWGVFLHVDAAVGVSNRGSYTISRCYSRKVREEGDHSHLAGTRMLRYLHSYVHGQGMETTMNDRTQEGGGGGLTRCNYEGNWGEPVRSGKRGECDVANGGK